MKKRPYIGVAVIVIKDGKVLLGKRKNSHGSGTWHFPGGHLEFNESIEACARREVFEETGLRIKNIRLGPYTNDMFEKEQKHYITLFAVSEYDSGVVELKEPEKCDTWDWFEWTQLPQPSFLSIQNLLKLNFKPPT
ncbi:MAG: NUDIX hydrolase [Pseudomonadota bacterium]|uniref:NUDIX domain-containing protein n=1 Tax=Candidatus Desulfatibia profunda TaxID=2841695 RepID=A0A8J6NVN9_9BACT|nr:NUDIX domain-containing protein [Candidatus Desulfatibia profunda]MBL7179171.1 NUDIX domain-containing protein [Desulfobacterales bacterium]